MRITLEQISKSYDLEKKVISVFDQLDWVIESGRMVALTGASGAGKSTLLNLIGTLDDPSSGRILFDDVPALELQAQALNAFRAQTIGFVFQFHHLLTELSALENVMLPLLIRQTSRAHAEARARYWLARVGLEARVNHKPSELSGGEQQRVALARAFVNDARVILADEPTGNLDEKTGHQILELLRDICVEKRTTIVLVTHNPGLAQLCDEVWHLENSQILRVC